MLRLALVVVAPHRLPQISNHCYEAVDLDDIVRVRVSCLHHIFTYLHVLHISSRMNLASLSRLSTMPLKHG